MSSSKEIFEKMFAHGGIAVNGSNPWDIQVHNPKFYDRVLSDGSLGIGESYMDGWWDCETLDEFFFRVQYYRVDRKLPRDWNTFKYGLKAKLFNMQTKKRSKKVVHEHYNIGNDHYERILDKWMQYSCGYWENATTLEEAQEAKLDLVCRKLKLEPGMRLLDLGCGWGGMAKFAAERYGVSVVGITISEEQAAYAREKCRGLPVEIRITDYRDVNEKFDRVACVAMTEHIGYRNYRSLAEVAARCLDDDGIYLQHTIGGNYSVKVTDPWIDKYIFPNGMLPSAAQLATATQGLFILEDWHNFGPDYYRTCMEWLKNFKETWNGGDEKYDETFYRMWVYYLSASASSFRSRRNHLWQIVYTKPLHLGMYKAVR